MADLFDDLQPSYEPLAARMRPRSLEEYCGQQHLLGADKPLRKALELGAIHSMILWGPPGVGKTTLARLLAHQVDAHFISLSAVLSGVKDIRAAVDQALQVKAQSGR
ncbi:MAG: AAA family ATPase, partial [Amphritea sp.]|nr:AAA family ATPase [Amphritea sp.]